MVVSLLRLVELVQIDHSQREGWVVKLVAPMTTWISKLSSGRFRRKKPSCRSDSANMLTSEQIYRWLDLKAHPHKQPSMHHKPRPGRLPVARSSMKTTILKTPESNPKVRT